MSSKETFKVISLIRGYHAYTDVWLPNVVMNMILNENQVMKRTPMPWQLYAKACAKGKNRLGSSQCEITHHDLSTEKQCSHPNEMTDDTEVIRLVPKLMPSG